MDVPQQATADADAVSLPRCASAITCQQNQPLLYELLYLQTCSAIFLSEAAP